MKEITYRFIITKENWKKLTQIKSKLYDNFCHKLKTYLCIWPLEKLIRFFIPFLHLQNQQSGSGQRIVYSPHVISVSNDIFLYFYSRITIEIRFSSTLLDLCWTYRMLFCIMRPANVIMFHLCWLSVCTSLKWFEVSYFQTVWIVGGLNLQYFFFFFFICLKTYWKCMDTTFSPNLIRCSTVERKIYMYVILFFSIHNVHIIVYHAHSLAQWPLWPIHSSGCKTITNSEDNFSENGLRTWKCSRYQLGPWTVRNNIGTWPW